MNGRAAPKVDSGRTVSFSPRPGKCDSRGRYLSLKGATLKILIVRLSAIGDVVRTLPALAALRRAWPDARIDWVVEPGSREILRDHPELSQLLVFPRAAIEKALLHPGSWSTARRQMTGLAAALREPEYDLVIDFQGTLKTGVISWYTRARRRAGLGFGHAREMAHLFYTERATIPRGRMNRVDRALALVASLGVDTIGVRGTLPERAEDAAFVDGFLSSASTPRPIVIFPGTSRTQAYKRYPPHLFARAADDLARRAGGPVVVAWGPGEEAIVATVKGAMRELAIVAPPMTIGQLSSLIRRARLFVSADTGPMHIAWMVGTPVVAIYGPTDPIVNRPSGEFSAVAWRAIYCGPCRNRGCVARTCLEALPPTEVADVAIDLLSRAEARA